MLQLTKEQEAVATAIQDFVLKSPGHPYIAVSGYAGTGKTTVMGYAAAKIINELPDIAIAYCAPTGKAASVLKGKLENFGALNLKSKVHTIHGHIYRLKSNTGGNLEWAKKGNKLPYDLVVVDEASMVTEQMFRDLLSYKIPIVFIGDPFQLPPVNSSPFYPLENTELKLKTVHRQALENPIVAVATDIRCGKNIPYGLKGNTFLKQTRRMAVRTGIPQKFFEKIPGNETMILCGTNKTRIQLNSSLRVMLGFGGKYPCEGEHLLCLRNEKIFDMYNGQIFIVDESMGPCKEDEACYRVKLNNGRTVIAYAGALNCMSSELGNRMRDDSWKIELCMENSIQEGPMLFDYGYVCSVHKSQGSEWDNVLLYDERTSYMSDTDHAKWLYTGVTRARNKLCIVA